MASTVVSSARSFSTRPCRRHFDHRHLGDDQVHDLRAGERQRAARQDLRAAVSGGVFHGHDHATCAGDEVHRAAHPLHHLPRDHPVGEVAVLIDLQCAEHGHVDVSAAHHRERVGRAEVAAAGGLGHRFLARVDQIGVDIGLERIRADAEHAVLRVQRDVHAGGHVIGDERRHADAEVDVVAVAKFPGDADDDAIALIHGAPSQCASRHGASTTCRAGCAARRCQAYAPRPARSRQARRGARPPRTSRARRWPSSG